MKKTLITSITAFAIVLSAGMAVAGPLRDHGHGGFTSDARSSVSQAFDHTYRKATDLQSSTRTDCGFDALAKYDLGQSNLSSTRQQSTYGTSWNSELPSVSVITGSNGSTSEFTIIPVGPPWWHHGR
ncbi:hypothetical protein AB1A64_02050 [Ruegeria sp. ANG10]|uniref:hypothetical protein n=1 Tax=Ruegeria sp. ANG10 TaxID=3042467 RepID=UPI0034525CBC